MCASHSPSGLSSLTADGHRLRTDTHDPYGMEHVNLIRASSEPASVEEVVAGAADRCTGTLGDNAAM
jgi:hypothetical protein